VATQFLKSSRPCSTSLLSQGLSLPGWEVSFATSLPWLWDPCFLSLPSARVHLPLGKCLPKSTGAAGGEERGLHTDAITHCQTLPCSHTQDKVICSPVRPANQDMPLPQTRTFEGFYLHALLEHPRHFCNASHWSLSQCGLLLSLSALHRHTLWQHTLQLSDSLGKVESSWSNQPTLGPRICPVPLSAPP
jgi:hypothetical protein